MLVIPTVATQNQSLDVLLGNQNCQIELAQKAFGMFINVYVSNALIIGGVICQDRNRIVRDAYLGFIGDLFFYDTQGTDDPTYEGLNSRYFLVYLEPADSALPGPS